MSVRNWRRAPTDLGIAAKLGTTKVAAHQKSSANSIKFSYRKKKLSYLMYTVKCTGQKSSRLSALVVDQVSEKKTNKSNNKL